jgi:HD-like signal output (HDOD) protein
MNHVFGMTLQSLGAKVAERWRLPKDIVAIIDGSGNPELVEMAKASHGIANALLAGEADLESLLKQLPESVSEKNICPSSINSFFIQHPEIGSV